MGGWRVAQSPIMVTTVTLERLRKHGYEALPDYYLKSSRWLNEPLYMGMSFMRNSRSKVLYVQWCEKRTSLPTSGEAVTRLGVGYSFILKQSV